MDCHTTPLPSSATPTGLSKTVTEPPKAAGKWMLNNLDGAHHPAFDTRVSGLVYDEEKDEYRSLAAEKQLDLYVAPVLNFVLPNVDCHRQARPSTSEQRHRKRISLRQ